MEKQAEEPKEQAQETEEQTNQETEVQETESQETESATTEEQATEEQSTEETTEESELEFKPYKIKVDGEDVEIKSDNELRELAQKGMHYTKKMQNLSEVEKNSAQQRQFVDQLSANPKVFEMLVAQNLGTDPSLVFRTPTPPNESLKDFDPVGYGRQVQMYENELRQKQLIENTVPLVIKGQVDATNNVVFQRGAITHDLNDSQKAEVQQFIQTRFRPNPMGMFSDDDVKNAVNLLYGSKKSEQEKLKSSENFNKKLKQLSKDSPGKSTSQRSNKEKESPEAAYLRYIEETSHDK